MQIMQNYVQPDEKQLIISRRLYFNLSEYNCAVMVICRGYNKLLKLQFCHQPQKHSKHTSMHQKVYCCLSIVSRSYQDILSFNCHINRDESSTNPCANIVISPFQLLSIFQSCMSERPSARKTLPLISNHSSLPSCSAKSHPDFKLGCGSGWGLVYPDPNQTFEKNRIRFLPNLYLITFTVCFLNR